MCVCARTRTRPFRSRPVWLGGTEGGDKQASNQASAGRRMEEKTRRGERQRERSRENPWGGGGRARCQSCSPLKALPRPARRVSSEFVGHCSRRAFEGESCRWDNAVNMTSRPPHLSAATNSSSSGLRQTSHRSCLPGGVPQKAHTHTHNNKKVHNERVVGAKKKRRPTRLPITSHSVPLIYPLI